MTDSTADIRSIPVAAITVMNPRVRGKQGFRELVASIATLGLKKPVTVRARPDGKGYNLVCGQGRLEACRELGATEIPAIVVEASQEECFVMSLVENLARRRHTPLDLIRSIAALRERGHPYAAIAERTGFSYEYITAICSLLDNGEHRLLVAVERGTIPHSVAIEIARAQDGDVQGALIDAYENRKLPGDQIVAIRKIVEQRRLMGKGLLHIPGPGGRTKRVSAEVLVRAYKREAERQRSLVKKAETAARRLMFVAGALGRLHADEHFANLLRAEGLPTMPRQLARTDILLRNPRMTKAVRAAFQDRTLRLPLEAIMPLRSLAPDLRRSVRYRRIAASIAEVGVIEPIVVSPVSGQKGAYLLLDGHVRLAILRERGDEAVACLVALDDDPFTYNKRVSHLATIQGHYMVMRALERGVPEKKLADALDMDVARIRRQRTMLDGICPEAVEMLKDRQLTSGVFPLLKKMSAARQVEVVELMASCGNYTTTYAAALLAGTRQADLANPETAKKVRGMSAEQMARMEREMTTLQGDFKAVEATYGNDMLELVVASAYVAKLLRNPQVERYLAERHAEFLEEFKAIVASNTLDTAA